MSIYQGIREFTNSQHGVVARFQLLNSGYSRSSIQRAVKRGYIESVYPGVYVLQRDKTNWKQQAAIGVFRHGSKALLSHDSVLVYYDLVSETSHLRDSVSNLYLPRDIHVVCNKGHHHLPGIRKHVTQYLDEREVINTKVGIPHISIETSFIFAAKHLNDAELDMALDRALKNNLINLGVLKQRIEAYASIRSLCTRKLKAILDPYYFNSNNLASACVASNVESVLEKRVQRIINRIKGTNFVEQFWVDVKGFKFRLDFADPQRKIAVEVDGFEYHRNRSQFDSDRERQNLLVSSGWRVIRVTSSMTDSQIDRTVATHYAQL